MAKRRREDEDENVVDGLPPPLPSVGLRLVATVASVGETGGVRPLFPCIRSDCACTGVFYLDGFASIQDFLQVRLWIENINEDDGAVVVSRQNKVLQQTLQLKPSVDMMIVGHAPSSRGLRFCGSPGTTLSVDASAVEYFHDADMLLGGSCWIVRVRPVRALLTCATTMVQIRIRLGHNVLNTAGFEVHVKPSSWLAFAAVTGAGLPLKDVHRALNLPIQKPVVVGATRTFRGCFTVTMDDQFVLARVGDRRVAMSIFRRVDGMQRQQVGEDGLVTASFRVLPLTCLDRVYNRDETFGSAGLRKVFLYIIPEFVQLTAAAEDAVAEDAVVVAVPEPAVVLPLTLQHFVAAPALPAAPLEHEELQLTVLQDMMRFLNQEDGGSEQEHEDMRVVEGLFL